MNRSPSSAEWRHPSERMELVERLVKAEKRAAIAEAKARALLADEPGDRITAQVTEMAVRIVELEDIVARLNGTIANLNQRRSA